MKKYRHLFFDLDRTIWDFDASTMDSFSRMYRKYELDGKGVPSVEDFKRCYDVHNDRLWDLYRKGKILKEVLSVKRFDMTLSDFGITNHMIAEGMSEDHVKLDPDTPFLMPFAIESLEYLSSRYRLHMLSNGFREVQEQKYRIARLDRFFDTVTTSEEAGIKKPEPGIFTFALDRACCQAKDALMIGDDLEVDVLGAQRIGMDQVFYNKDGIEHDASITYEIVSLKELMEIL